MPLSSSQTLPLLDRGQPLSTGQHQYMAGLSVEESIRMTEDRVKWMKYVHGVVNPRIEDI